MPNVIDLFAGAGGLSLGAIRAGFKLLASVENDPIAVNTHKKNFPNTKHLSENISNLKGDNLLEAIKIKKGKLDGLIGGPPCQGFSVIGFKNTQDPRNDLFGHFFRLVNETKPKFYVAENVVGIQNGKFTDIRKQAFDLVHKDYGEPIVVKVKANDYGAPTTRTRIFFVGYRRSHISQLTEESFLPPSALGSVYVKDALRGLPEDVSPDWQTEEDSWRPFEPLNDNNHYALRISGLIPEGVGDQASIERCLVKKEISGCLGTRHGADITSRFENTEPGSLERISRLPRLSFDGFCPTLRAGTGKDKGSHQGPRPIHPRFHRVITPREGARLQGFPDWFIFHPTKWHSFRQIGNSVSPFVAESLLKTIYNNLR